MPGTEHLSADDFLKYFAIRSFLLKAVYPADYRLPDAIYTNIALTKDCQVFLEEQREKLPKNAEQDHAVGAFIAGYADAGWIDYENTDLQALQDSLSQEVSQGNIRFPWFFGHSLLDSYKKQSVLNEDDLSTTETDALLKDQPLGVVQVAKYLAGPLGILESATVRRRAIFPTTEIPLRYCTDPSCLGLHTVSLSGSTPPFLASFGTIRNVQNRLGTKLLDLSDQYDTLCDRSESYYSDWNSADLPALLGNGFVHDELQSIVANLIQNCSADMRNRLPRRKEFAGSATDISRRFGPSELFQIAMLAGDADIVKAIEQCITFGEIAIPRGEQRVSHIHRGRGGWLNMNAECSADGIRFVPSKPEARAYLAETRLRNLIVGLFPEEESRTTQLEYVLRAHAADTIEERLATFVATTAPHEIAKEVFLAVGSRVRAVQESLRFGDFPLPDGADGDVSWVRKVTWKLGFDSPDVESLVATFDLHSRQFVDAIRRNDPTKFVGREAIRQASISYFVSLEAVLDLALVFSTWALSSDHYASNQFRFCASWAKEFVVPFLAEASEQTSSGIEFAESGHWTLFPLTEGFRVLSKYLKLLSDTKAGSYKRTEIDTPGFANATTLARFPFTHTLPFLDLSMRSKTRLIDHLESISNRLAQANVAGLRNRLEHSRPPEDFPNQDELEMMCEAISKILASMELAGTVPTPLRLHQTIIDGYGRGKKIFKDFRGRQDEIAWPHELARSTRLDFRFPVVVMNEALIEGTPIPLRFNWIGASKYADYWKDYPKHH